MKTLFIATLLASLWVGTYAQSSFTSLKSCEPKNNCTIYGIVESKGQGIANVAVSDGYEITLTDSEGHYYLNSEKRNGYVFVSTPGNYTYTVDGAVPQMWANLEKGKAVAERHDFQLLPANHQEFTFIGLTDIHLANYYDAQQNLRQKVMPAIQRTMKYIRKKYGKNQKVYSLNAGDSSYDTYWKVGTYTIRDFPATLKDIRYPTPMFSVMGNHDNDPFELYGEDVDFRAEQAYRDALGPTYYSFNIGKVHFIAMDNLIYKNQPGDSFLEVGLPGKKDYLHGFSANQLEWLRKDLQLQDHSCPLVILIHDPIFLRKGLDTKIYRQNSDDPQNYKDFIELIKDFPEIHLVDGHTHVNYTFVHPSLPIIDHNISSICGSWWRTGFKGYDTYTMGRTQYGESVLHKGHDQFCPDGTPTGVEIFHVNGKNITWEFQSLNDPIGKQFRTFDMNEVRTYSQHNSNYEKFISAYPERYDYRQVPLNEVWLNVWAWDRTWKVRVWEDGKEIPAKPALLENPQYTYCYNFFMTVDQNRFDNPSYKKVKHGNMFRIQCSSPSSRLEIEVTDHFGNVYKETMIRPKAFHPDMK